MRHDHRHQSVPLIKTGNVNVHGISVKQSPINVFTPLRETPFLFCSFVVPTTLPHFLPNVDLMIGKAVIAPLRPERVIGFYGRIVNN